MLASIAFSWDYKTAADKSSGFSFSIPRQRRWLSETDYFRPKFHVRLLESGVKLAVPKLATWGRYDIVMTISKKKGTHVDVATTKSTRERERVFHLRCSLLFSLALENLGNSWTQANIYCASWGLFTWTHSIINTNKTYSLIWVCRADFCNHCQCFFHELQRSPVSGHCIRRVLVPLTGNWIRMS